MNAWIVRIFGRNNMNFYGWCFTGAVLLIIVAVCAVNAVAESADKGLSIQEMLLLGILLMLVGQFGIQLSEYCAKYADRLESGDKLSQVHMPIETDRIRTPANIPLPSPVPGVTPRREG